MSTRETKLQLLDEHINQLESDNLQRFGSIQEWPEKVVADYEYWVGQRRRTFRGNKVSRLSREPAVDCEACQ